MEVALKYFKKLYHFYYPRRCISNVCIVDCELRCALCGESLGFYYRIQNDLKVFIYPKFRQYTKQLNKIVQDKVKTKNNIEDQWSELHSYIKLVCRE